MDGFTHTQCPGCLGYFRVLGNHDRPTCDRTRKAKTPYLTDHMEKFHPTWFLA